MIKLNSSSQNLLFKVVLIVIVYLIFGKPILNKLGITKSKSDRIRAEEEQDNNSPFKTALWRKYLFISPALGGVPFPGGKQITAEAANRCIKSAQQIFEGFGYMTDDEAKIKGAFNMIKTQAECSLMSWYFLDKYSVDLLDYLANGKDVMPQNGLGDYDVLKIISQIKSLPLK